jgi:hypothetical protein
LLPEPKCRELLYHSRDFSKSLKQGHSSKSPWHIQWHVTTKQKQLNEKCYHFIWKPYYYSKIQKQGIHKKERWLYKDNDHAVIKEFWLTEFFELCDRYSNSHILRDREFFKAF